MHNISILVSRQPSLCKRFHKEEGVIKSAKASMPAYFDYERRSVEGIKEFAGFLSSMESDRSRFIIRGQLSEDVDTDRPMRRRIHRPDRTAPNESPFIDVAAPWLMIDVDKLALPERVSIREEPLVAINHAISLLPVEFRNASVFWQLSGSAGVVDDNVVSAHLFYWLDRPLANDVLRQWANSIENKRLIDPAVFNAVQAHYIASPIFDAGCDDPYPEGRSGIIEKSSSTVNLRITQSTSVTHRTTTSSEIVDDGRARGFRNILATLGDHEGGAGFNSPLVRSVASFVSQVGGDEAEEKTDWLKGQLRDAIDEANQSDHDLGEIERYKSDQYLDGSITGAIEKFGDKASFPPHFDTKLVSVEDGEEALEEAINAFASAVAKFNSTPDKLLFMDTPTLAIKATAGLGKTSRIIKQLISASALKQGDVHYFVPTHRLSKELVADLEAELDFDLTDKAVKLLGGSGEGVYKRVRLISGRGQLDNTGRTMCWKNELAQQIASSGQNVSSTLCKNGTERCEYYEQCGYQAQFEQSGIEVPTDDDISELLWEVSVMTHDHMFLNTKDRLLKPGLVVVDESFYQQGIRTEEVSPTELYQTNQPISRFLYDAIVSGEHPLLERIRREGYSADELVAEAEAIENEDAGNHSNLISPALGESRQRILLRSVERVRKATLIHRQLAEELRKVDRGISHSVYFDDQKDKIVVTSRRELTIPSYIPTVFIDADVQPEILKLFRDDVEIKEIPVERKATVHQFTDLTFSKTALLSENELLSQAKAFAAAVGATGKTLLVCSKAVRIAITGELDKSIDQDYLWAGVTVTHFGSLRGVNKYEDYNNVIILGREQPAAIACENQAKALWWDAEDPLTLLETKSGSKPLEQTHRGYRVAGGEHSSVQVQIHPDHRVGNHPFFN